MIYISTGYLCSCCFTDASISIRYYFPYFVQAQRPSMEHPELYSQSTGTVKAERKPKVGTAVVTKQLVTYGSTTYEGRHGWWPGKCIPYCVYSEYIGSVFGLQIRRGS